MIALRVRGIGFWAPGVADWSQARALLASGDAFPAAGSHRAAPAIMPANERRRAPDSVLLALSVAEQASAGAGIDIATLPSVFASIYGDLAINDYMCATLRDDPSAMSPTKFHNSVHNAPSGYWSIATGAMSATSSVAASIDTFAAGLLEAACQSAERGGPVLLAAYDSAGSGPVAEVSSVHGSFGCAFVIDAAANEDGPRLALDIVPATSRRQPAMPEHGDLRELASRHPITAGAGALLEALACATSLHLELPLSISSALRLELQP